MCHHFVPVQTGPAKLVNMPIGQTDRSGQLDAFDEAQHIHPNFHGQIYYNFPEIKKFK
jgi:hypothetical protein